jgi:hypothetical protein
MDLIKPGTTFDFVRYAKGAAILSLVLILLGVLSVLYRGGLNYGVALILSVARSFK